MRRLALIFALIAASVGGLAASASGEDVRTYYIELDNAFGLVKGSPVKVAGVEAGTITDFQINSQKRAVAKVELTGPVSILGQDTICSTDPQSLIAEYFIDCTPKGPPIETIEGSEEEHAEKPDIPVEQTRQTVQQDLVQSTMREPFRERLTLLINEFGTALAGNGEELNAAIRRGAPALEETEKVFNLLASQNSIIRDLNVNSDRIITRLNESRQDVVDFIEEAENTARISAAVRDELGQNFALLDDFLVELRPTMADLNGLAVSGTPLAADLRAAAPGLTELSRDLPAFNAAGTDALVSLGKTSVVGQQALDQGQDEIAQLADTAKNSFAPADDLAKFLRDISDPKRAVEEDARAAVDTGRAPGTGYTGMEGLLNYVYYQPGAINQYDEIGHLLHFSIFEVGEGPCANYSAGFYDPDGPGPQEGELGWPNLDGSAATTDPAEANRCVAILGDSQPDINEPLNLPPYDPSVCPEGSANPELCAPATTFSAAESAQRSAASGGDSVDSPTEPRPVAPGSSSGSTPDAGGDAVGSGEGEGTLPVPGVPEVPDAAGDLGEVPGVDPSADGARPRPSDATTDMLGYLFGS